MDEVNGNSQPAAVPDGKSADAAPPGHGPEAEPFEDRTLQIRIAGVFQIVLGCIAGLMSLLMFYLFFANAVPPVNNAGGTKVSMLSPAITYLVISLFLIWTGIAAIMLRRWVRAIMLSLSVPGLVIGAMATTFMFFFLPLVFKEISGQQAAPDSAMGCAKGCIYTLLVVAYIIIPGMLTLLYMGKNVRLTFQAKDPVRRWTDACPLPVLGLALWQCLGGFALLFTTFNAFPLFGQIYTGMAARVLIIFIALLSFAFGLGNFLLKNWAWWGTVIKWLVFSISNIITLNAGKFSELYSASGMMDQRSMKIYELMGTTLMPHIVIMVTLSVIILAAYMIYIKRFYTPRIEQGP